MEGRVDALNDLEKAMNPKLSSKFKIVIIILSVVIVGLIVGIIVLEKIYPIFLMLKMTK